MRQLLATVVLLGSIACYTTHELSRSRLQSRDLKESTSGTAGQSNAAEKQALRGPPNAPLIFLKHNFGFLGANERADYEFTLKNDSNTAWTFDRAEPSCGCVSAQSYPSTIVPASAGEFLVNFDPNGKHGRVNERVVFTSKKDSKVVVTEIEALVRGLWVDPSTMDLGTISNGVPVTSDLFVITAGYPDAQIESATTQDSWLKITRYPVNMAEKMIVKQEKAIARLQIDWLGTDLPPGRVVSNIRVVTNLGKENKLIQVPVTGTISGPFSVIPRQILFGNLTPGKKVSRTCIVRRDNGGRDPRTMNYSSDTSWLNVVASEDERGDRNVCTFTATLDVPRDGAAGLLQGAIVGRDKNTDRVLLSIPYTGYVIR